MNWFVLKWFDFLDWLEEKTRKTENKLKKKLGIYSINQTLFQLKQEFRELKKKVEELDERVKKLEEWKNEIENK